MPTPLIYDFFCSLQSSQHLFFCWFFRFRKIYIFIVEIHAVFSMSMLSLKNVHSMTVDIRRHHFRMGKEFLSSWNRVASLAKRCFRCRCLEMFKTSHGSLLVKIKRLSNETNYTLLSTFFRNQSFELRRNFQL